jgi:hypothetical protein
MKTEKVVNSKKIPVEKPVSVNAIKHLKDTIDLK